MCGSGPRHMWRGLIYRGRSGLGQDRLDPRAHLGDEGRQMLALTVDGCMNVLGDEHPVFVLAGVAQVDHLPHRLGHVFGVAAQRQASEVRERFQRALVQPASGLLRACSRPADIRQQPRPEPTAIHDWPAVPGDVRQEVRVLSRSIEGDELHVDREPGQALAKVLHGTGRGISQRHEQIDVRCPGDVIPPCGGPEQDRQLHVGLGPQHRAQSRPPAPSESAPTPSPAPSPRSRRHPPPPGGSGRSRPHAAMCARRYPLPRQGAPARCSYVQLSSHVSRLFMLHPHV